MAKKQESGVSRYKRSEENAVSGNSAQKYTEDVLKGKSKLDDFFHVECNKLTVFSLKELFDFSPWDPDKFERLKESIEEVGVLQPIIARHTKDSEKPYEILAGEHRWKASCELGLKTIPCKIVHPCDDEKAKTIFTLTNILSRDLTVVDKILGWGHYYQITKARSTETIERFKDEGIISQELNTDEYSRKQIKRFYQISTLEPKILNFISMGILGTTAASVIAIMPQESKDLIIKHADQFKDKKQFKRLIELYNGKIPNHVFDDVGISYILSGNPISVVDKNVDNFTSAVNISKKSLKKKLKQEDYHRADDITESAISLFYQLEEDSDILMKLSAHVSGENSLNKDEIPKFNGETVTKIIESSIILTALEEYFEKNPS